MSTNSNDPDRDYGARETQYENASMLLTPAVSCWEAGRWELTKSALRRNSTSVRSPEKFELLAGASAETQ